MGRRELPSQKPQGPEAESIEEIVGQDVIKQNEEVEEAESIEEMVGQAAMEQNEDVKVEAQISNGIVVGCFELNVREEPSLYAKVLGTIVKGTKVKANMSESTNDFYKVTTNGVIGFCMKKFIKIY